MVCESSSFASVGKWYLKLACSALAYLVISELYVLDIKWRWLTQNPKELWAEKSISSTTGKGLHKFSTSELQHDPGLNGWSVWICRVGCQKVCFREIEYREAFIVPQRQQFPFFLTRYGEQTCLLKSLLSSPVCLEAMIFDKLWVMTEVTFISSIIIKILNIICCLNV